MLLNTFDVICISETWLTTDVNDSELFLANYTIFRSDRVYFTRWNNDLRHKQ